MSYHPPDPPNHPYAWVKKLKVGDVLKSRTGMLRIVRSIHVGPTVASTRLIFTIQHCSWTTRGYTVYTGNDLRQMGYSKVGRKRYKLKDHFDKLLAEDFRRGGNASECNFHCCDVIGIP